MTTATWKNSAGNSTEASLTFWVTEKILTMKRRCALTGLDGVTVYTNEVTILNPTYTVNNVVYELIDGIMTVIGYDGEYTTYTVEQTVAEHTVTIIGASAFEGNTTMVSIDLPDTITVISKRAFAGCTNLSEMK